MRIHHSILIIRMFHKQFFYKAVKMKNSILIVLAGSIICLFFTKCNRHLHQNAESTGYPAATKYATILYATEVNTKEGNITNLAGHSVLKGNGQFTWEQQINAEGEYEMILSYSVRKDGAAVLVGSEKNTASGAIEITKGAYETGTEWYRFNCERKLLPGKLVLKKGI